MTWIKSTGATLLIVALGLAVFFMFGVLFKIS
jgi:hypothetical protein